MRRNEFDSSSDLAPFEESGTKIKPAALHTADLQERIEDGMINEIALNFHGGGDAR